MVRAAQRRAGGLLPGLLAAAAAGLWAAPGSGPPPAAGAGSAPGAALPASVHDARTRHAEALRRCAAHPVAAVRAECRREADRALARDLRRLGATGR